MSRAVLGEKKGAVTPMVFTCRVAGGSFYDIPDEVLKPNPLRGITFGQKRMDEYVKVEIVMQVNSWNNVQLLNSRRLKNRYNFSIAVHQLHCVHGRGGVLVRRRGYNLQTVFA